MDPAKGDDINEMRAELEVLRKRMDEKEKASLADEVVAAERAVKEEARKRPDGLSLDTLHQKLVRLDDVARRAEVKQADREKYSAVLERFTFYRAENYPNIGQFILRLLATPAENSILEKERKLMKGQLSRQKKDEKDGEKNERSTQSAPPPNIPQSYPPVAPPQYASYPPPAWGQPPQAWGPPFTPGYGAPYMGMQDGGFRPPARHQSRGSPYGGRGGRYHKDERCFKCHQRGHFMRDCPNSSPAKK